MRKKNADRWIFTQQDCTEWKTDLNNYRAGLQKVALLLKDNWWYYVDKSKRNARQKAARRDGAEAAGTMKGLKEATAVLKDLAAVAKALNEQGADAEGRECGVVLLPPVEDV